MRINSSIDIGLGVGEKTNYTINDSFINTAFSDEYKAAYLDMEKGPTIDIELGSAENGLRIDSISATYSFAPGVSTSTLVSELQNKSLIEDTYKDHSINTDKNQSNNSNNTNSNSKPTLNITIKPDGTISGSVNNNENSSTNSSNVKLEDLKPSTVKYSGVSGDVFDYSKPKPNKEDVFKLIDSIAPKYGMEPAMVKAIVQAESNFNNQCISRSGAVGLIQLMPVTAREVGLRVDSEVDERWDPAKNIEAGIKYISKYHKIISKHFGKEDWDLTLAGYNAGPNRVIRDGGIPNIKETQNYVKKVNKYINNYR